MGMHNSIHIPFGAPGSPHSKPGDLGDTMGGVEFPDPLIEPFNLCPPIPVLWGVLPIVWIPDQLGNWKDGGNSKRVGLVWVVLVLAFHIPPEPLNAVGDLVKTFTLDEVVFPSYQHDPHGVLLLVVVESPGIHQVVYFGSRYGQPINMGSICRTYYTWIT